MTQTMPPWDDLPKTQTDPTTINEEIDILVAAHDADPDAHMQALASLEIHRQNDILDHPAESVVNDKLAPPTRAYTAIVDPNSEPDFATIKQALAYLKTVGGGTMLVRSGSHFVSDKLTVPKGVSIVGEGIGVTVVHCANASGAAFYFSGSIDELTAVTTIKSLSFARSNGICLLGDLGQADIANSITFDTCSFESGGTYGDNITASFTFADCTFDVTTAALKVQSARIKGCFFDALADKIVITKSSGGTDHIELNIADTELTVKDGNVFDAPVKNSLFFNVKFATIFETIPGAAANCSQNKFIACTIITRQDKTTRVGGSVILITNSELSAESYAKTTAYIRLDATSRNCLIANNYLIHEVKSDNGSGNVISANVLIVQGSKGPEYIYRVESIYYKVSSYMDTQLGNYVAIFQAESDYVILRNSGDESYRIWEQVDTNGSFGPILQTSTAGQVKTVQWFAHKKIIKAKMQDDVTTVYWSKHGNKFQIDTVSFPSGLSSLADIYFIDNSYTGYRIIQATKSKPWKMQFYDYNSGNITLTRTCTGPSIKELNSDYYQRLLINRWPTFNDLLYTLSQDQKTLFVYNTSGGTATILHSEYYVGAYSFNIDIITDDGTFQVVREDTQDALLYTVNDSAVKAVDLPSYLTEGWRFHAGRIGMPQACYWDDNAAGSKNWIAPTGTEINPMQDGDPTIGQVNVPGAAYERVVKNYSTSGSSVKFQLYQGSFVDLV